MGVERRIWLIAGPTASGKSALAIQLAEKHKGVVVNADSMQVYRDLRIITARPSEVDEARVPHRLYGHVDGVDAYSTAHWAKDVAVLLKETDAEQPLIFVGGTGLYFKALLVGLSDMPEIPEPVRRRWRYRLSEEGASRLHRVLRAQDPLVAAELSPADGQRIVRALEVLETSGKSISHWRGNRKPALLDQGNVEKMLMMPDRDILRKRIAARFDFMLKNGALAEVATLLKRELDPSLPVMKAIGVSICRNLIADEITHAEAVERGVIETSQYAKRQRTWFRNQFDDQWRVVSPEEVS
ncbi:MAG: tRNA (adenosine(37)-N6)-dimethylallyltransferase MiaA [Pseudomonadota bacterium]